MSKVSVVIPLYNQKHFVAQAIASALEQSHSDLEVIVVDDGSSDSPESVLDQYSANIRVVRQANAGLAAARNAGLGMATGEFIQFLDADDYLYPEKISMQLKLMAAERAKISYCEVTQLDDASGRHSLRYVGEVEDLFFNLYTLWVPYPLPIHSLLIHRGIFDDYGGFPEDFQAAEDRLFLSRIALNGEKIVYCPIIGGARRLHRTNMNKDRQRIYRNMVNYYRTINAHTAVKSSFLAQLEFTPQQMAAANLTHMWLYDLMRGMPIVELVRIRTWLAEEGFGLYFIPIPKPSIPLKRVLLPTLALLRRYTNNLKRTLPGGHG